jgi:Na+/H+-dicarboxylate symporter
MPLWKKVIIGMILGVCAGLILKGDAVYLKPFGDLFIRLVKMVIIPLVFVAIVGGVSSIQDSTAIGRLGAKASLAYILTTMFAVTIGIAVALIFEPGKGVILNLGEAGLPVPSVETGFFFYVNMILNIVPDNAIGAMAQGVILPVVFFAMFTGVVINFLNEDDAKRFSEFFRLLSQLFFKMINIIVELSPMAAFALTAWIIGTQGLDVLQKLMTLVGCAFVAFFVQYLFFGIIIAVWARLSPLPFYRKSVAYQAVAFSTSSSKAVLPLTMEICQKRLGVSSVSSSFVLPLGAAINMDGMAIYLSLCTLFFAQIVGIDLNWASYATIIFTATLGSIGAAGVPSGSMVMLPIVLASVGLPIEGIALIVGIDRIMDMVRTTLNITGDVAITICVDRSEGRLNPEIYYGKDKA